MNTHEVLVKARNLIDREGWGNSPVKTWCVLGAIGKVTQFADDDFERGYQAFSVHALGECPSFYIGNWNDAPGRTEAEVLAAFDKAIAATAPEPADPLAGVTIEAEALDAPALRA